MMEIDFRAWDVAKKEFVIEDIMIYTDKEGTMFIGGIADNGLEIKQSIGRKDKEGNKIYIGDILYWEDDAIILIKEKEDLGFYYEVIKSFDENVISHDIRFYRSEESCKIIGNIYKNEGMKNKTYWSKKRIKELEKFHNLEGSE